MAQSNEQGKDTNQASEDVVDSILSTLGIVDRKSGNRPNQIQVVKQIISTEKLKLLAAVRERAQSMPIHGGTDSYSPSKYVQAVSIDALTKLEAEL